MENQKRNIQRDSKSDGTPMDYQRELLKHWPFPRQILDDKPHTMPSLVLEGMDEAPF